MKTMRQKVDTLKQVLMEIREDTIESIAEYEPTNAYAIKVRGKVEGLDKAILLVENFDYLKAKDE